MANTYQFGVGQVFLTPTDPTQDQTPMAIMTLQEVSVSFASSQKDLFGANTFAESSGRGTTSVTGKVVTGRMNQDAIPFLLWNQRFTTGSKVTVTELGTVAATTPYVVVVTQGATFVKNFQVADPTTGLVYKQVASAPSQGQYTLDPTTGTYTFNAADEGKSLSFTYQYNTTTGRRFDINNQLMGTSQVCSMDLIGQKDGVQYTMRLNRIVFTKFDLDLKNDDFGVPNLEFSAYCDDLNQLGSWEFAQDH